MHRFSCKFNNNLRTSGQTKIFHKSNVFNVDYQQRIRIVFLLNSKLSDSTEWNKSTGRISKQKQIIAQSHISIIQGGFQYKLNNGACTIIPYPTVEVNHIRQVYVGSELKIKLFYFFTIRAMVSVFIAAKNRYLNLSAVLKFAAIQNKPKQAETK